MEITIQNYGNKFSADLHADCDIIDVAYALRGLLLAATFQEETVDKILPSLDEIDDLRNESSNVLEV